MFPVLSQPDFRKAVHWFSMCREYDSTQSECAVSLCRVYLNMGQLDAALRELHELLRQEQESREMVEYLGHWDCIVPSLAAKLFASKALVYGVARDEAMYFFLLVGIQINLF